MHRIFQIYQAEFSILLEPIGFRYVEGSFARVHGEIMQSLTLNFVSGRNRCTIYFAMIPLCQKIERVYSGLYNLRSFSVQPTLQQGNSWDYGHTKISCLQCVQDMLSDTKKYLLPIFEKCYNCKDTLSELLKLEQHFYAVRFQSLRHWGMPDALAANSDGINRMDGRKYYMALKAKNFALAGNMMEAKLQNNIELLKRDKPEQAASWKENMERVIAREYEDLQHIKENDIPYFERILNNNESYSREILKRYGLL